MHLRYLRHTLALLASILMSGAVFAAQPEAPIRISFRDEVRPILQKNCVICHACYDAPCQLKMESAEGLERGASKAVVYDNGRLKDQDPTRLHHDASSPEEWRGKGFFPVLEGGTSSLMHRMLELGRSQPLPTDKALPEDMPVGPARKNECPTSDEFEGYQHRRVHQGMPFGMAPLPPDELDTLQAWLQQGAPVEPEAEAIPAEVQGLVARWEEWLNRPGPKEKLIARYVYEHLFLAHLHLDEEGGLGFFELVRSVTPPGAPIQVIATRRPSDDPGPAFHYRLRPLRELIVQKTHITYPFGAAEFSRVQELFARGDWEVDTLPAYGWDAARNPFRTFEAIPAKLRYAFMLEHAMFYVQSFIRGPVCRGQVATDVIDDHSWALFLDPKEDYFLLDDEYAKEQIPDLDLEGTVSGLVDLGPDWIRSELRYGRRKVERYQRDTGPSMRHIWHGDGTNHDAALTVLRSFDNSTVVRGLRGRIPKTLWMLDYPLIERMYYVLVANFDVFGTAAHKVQTRLYFDLLRAESEVGFLRFMPRDVRQEMHDSWYIGTVAQLKVRAVYPPIDRLSGAPIKDTDGDPKVRFVELLREQMPDITGAPDDLTGNSTPDRDRALATPESEEAERLLRTLTEGVAATRPFIQFLPEITYLRIGSGDPETDRAYTLFRDRAHRNVAFLFREESRLMPDQDEITLLRGPAGAYPNFIFQIPAGRVGRFVDQLAGVQSSADFKILVTDFGVRRTHPEFWESFDFFRRYQQRVHPLEGGGFDASQYANY